jgi:hypothetical protein
MNATRVLDTSAWLLSVPLLPAAGTLDFSVGLLTAAFTSTLGGLPIVTASSVDPDNRITFVPATADAVAKFLIDLPNDRRTPFTVQRPLSVFADIKWHPDPTRPAYNEPVARLELLVEPGTDSPGIATPSGVPVLMPAIYYDERILAAPIIVGPQGVPGYPAVTSADEGATLKIVNGTPTWVL